MYPHERSLVRILADKPFAIIGVNSDQERGKSLEQIQQIVKTKNLTWRSFQNTANDPPISKAWAVKFWPTVYLIDAKGVIRYEGLHGDDLDGAIEELMAEIDHDVKLVGVDHQAEDEKAMKAAAE